VSVVVADRRPWRDRTGRRQDPRRTRRHAAARTFPAAANTRRARTRNDATCRTPPGGPPRRFCGRLCSV